MNINIHRPKPRRTSARQLDAATRVSIEANICSADGIVSTDCFAAAQQLCYTALRLYYFPRFRQSDVFYKFLNGMLCRTVCAVWF